MVKECKKEYGSSTLMIQDMDVKAKKIQIMGKNGVGKSTLLRAISGLIEVKGDATIDGDFSYYEDIASIASIPVIHLLQLVRSIDTINEEHYQSLYQMFQIGNMEDIKMDALSDGMRVKVLLLVTFMKERSTYILDEPFRALDKESVQYFKSFLMKSSKNIILATHKVKLDKRVFEEVVLSEKQ
jgi:ABC-type multidrug transport system ATPase subunit